MKKINSVAHNISKSLYEIYYGKSSVVGLPYIPQESEYLYKDDDSLELEVKAEEYEYKNPRTGELFFFNKKSNYKDLVFVRQVSFETSGSFGSVYLNRPFNNQGVENGFSVYITEKDTLVRIDFFARESDNSTEVNTPKYWSNKVGKFNGKTQTNN